MEKDGGSAHIYLEQTCPVARFVRLGREKRGRNAND